VIRRIFSDYASGMTPRDREGIPSPRGRRWNASTINGNVQRGAGIILNDINAGRLLWEKVRMVKNPDTGRRISRPNPRDKWQAKDAPHLRIVDEQGMTAWITRCRSDSLMSNGTSRRRTTAGPDAFPR
jgi:site-specific DNA recombinase